MQTVPNWCPKLVPEIGPESVPEIGPELVPEIANLATMATQMASSAGRNPGRMSLSVGRSQEPPP
jgi:hypothetical protein